MADDVAGIAPLGVKRYDPHAFTVSGGALAAHTERILEGLKDLIHSNFKDSESDRWEHTIADLVQREMTILKKLNEQQVAEALKGDSPDYFTLWESRN